MSESHGPGSAPIDAEKVDPEHASSERAAETPPHADSERMEAALREGGPLRSLPKPNPEDVPDIEDGPGTSLG